jgi:hypothetical protein
MTLKRRLVLALILTPAFWLPLLGLYIVSSIPQLGHHIAAVALIGLTAYTCAYSVVLFCHAWCSDLKA